jgi:hypothetical protein
MRIPGFLEALFQSSVLGKPTAVLRPSRRAVYRAGPVCDARLRWLGLGEMKGHGVEMGMGMEVQGRGVETGMEVHGRSGDRGLFSSSGRVATSSRAGCLGWALG